MLILKELTARFGMINTCLKHLKIMVKNNVDTKGIDSAFWYDKYMFKASLNNG